MRPINLNGKLQVAIIGAGLAGSMLASSLRYFCQVTVFERGSRRGEKPADIQFNGHPTGFDPSFFYGVGGTTNLWAGGLVDMLPSEFSDAWPDRVKDALPSFYAEVVERLYGFGSAEAWRRRSHQKLGDRAHISEIYYPISPFRVHGSPLLASVDLRTCCHIIAIVEKGNGVDLSLVCDGQHNTETFDVVIVAAGGLNSPLLLQRSGLGGPHTGQNHTDHPMGFIAKLERPQNREIFDRLRTKFYGFENSKPLTKIQDEKTGLWSAFYLRPAATAGLTSDPYERTNGFLSQSNVVLRYLLALSQLYDPDFLYQILEHRLNIHLPSAYTYVMVVNEQERDGQGTVTSDLSGGGHLDWRVSGTVKQAIGRTLARYSDILEADLHLPPDGISGRLYSAAHYSGTCRISEDESSGTVDENLQIHGSDRIYVCDGSVLPSTGATNTGLTIAALALRLVEHLRSAHVKTPAAQLKKDMTLPDMLISGAGGNIGTMVRAHLTDGGRRWTAVNLREGAPQQDIDPAITTLLHLANIADNVQDNLNLQHKMAKLIEMANIRQVILPMSFSTLAQLDGGPDPKTLNFGFQPVMNDPYPHGKIEVEKFWLDWQCRDAGRKLLLLYIPTVIGPHAFWSNKIARFAPGKTLLVPKLDRFFMIREAELFQLFLESADAGLASGVKRVLVATESPSLASVISYDRDDGPVQEVGFPPLLDWLSGVSEQHGVVETGLLVQRKLLEQLLKLVSPANIIPLSPKYLKLFTRQNVFADALEHASVHHTRSPQPAKTR